MLFEHAKIDAFDMLLIFFFSYQIFELKLSIFFIKLPISCNITLQDILHAIGW